MARIASVGLALALMLAGHAPAWAVGEFESGRWSGKAYLDGGRFTHCAMFADFVSRWRLLFSIDRDGDVNVGFASDRVGMYPWESTKIWMQIDNDKVTISDFKPVRPQLLLAKLGPDPDWIKRLRKGKKLKVNVGKRVPNFDLDGIDEAIGALFACAKKYDSV